MNGFRRHTKCFNIAFSPLWFLEILLKCLFSAEVIGK
jgi:hypothetical protein